ncbi:MAG: hypothetical protein ABGX26_04065 [Nautiliaceae bacterium]
MLVYTKDTSENAENLKKLLDMEIKDVFVEDVKENYLKVSELLLKELNNFEIEKIFLDYTGGLKSMSLGAFLAVEKLNLLEEQKYISYVYFDRQENKSKIIFKRGDVYELNEPLSIDEIAKIHGYFDLNNYKTQNSEFFSIDSVLWLLEKVKDEEEEFFENLWDKDLKDLKKMDWKNSLISSPINSDISNKRDIPKILCLRYYSKKFSFVNSKSKFHNEHLV